MFYYAYNSTDIVKKFFKVFIRLVRLRERERERERERRITNWTENKREWKMAIENNRRCCGMEKVKNPYIFQAY